MKRFRIPAGQLLFLSTGSALADNKAVARNCYELPSKPASADATSAFKESTSDSWTKSKAMKLSIAIGLTSLSFFTAATTYATEQVECTPKTAQASTRSFASEPLPQRTGPRVQTSGRVPHVQIDVDLNRELYNQLQRLAYLLPGLEERPTIVSLPGTKGMWLTDKVPVAKPSAIVSGREFAHIHTDGSLHAPLPYKRALELEQKGWGERHPWADRNDGWEGLVMLYSAQNKEQLKILLQLVTESYNYVTGQEVAVPDC